MKKYIDQHPKQKALTLALAAALTGLTPLVAKADCAGGGTISISQSDSTSWSSGNCSITSSGNAGNGSASQAINVSGTVGILTNSGTIDGSVDGIFNSGSIAFINNQNNAVIEGLYNTGIDSQGTIGTLTNSGTINGKFFGITNGTNGTIGTLTNSGTISGADAAVQNVGSIGTLINSGTINSNGVGNGDGNGIGIINLTSNGAVGTIGTLTNNGTISGGSTAVQNAGSIGALINNGTIEGGTIGVNNTGSISILTNTSTGTISGAAFGIHNALNTRTNVLGTIGTLTNSGLINGGGTGIQNYGSIGTLSNSGTINGNGVGIVNFTGNGVVGTIGALTNNGAISGGSFGIQNGGTIGTLTNRGTINGGNTGIWNNGTIGTLSNSGTVRGGAVGIGNSNSGNAGGVTIGILNNSGLLSGSHFGIYTGGTIGTLINSSTISGAGLAGIGNFGTIGALNNSGIISGDVGIYNDEGGSIGSLNNIGLITGSGCAIYNGAAGTLGSITNSGVIAGNITNLTSNDLNINGGAGTTFGTLTGFGGGNTIGTITNTASNVVFGAGNLLLNDNINAVAVNNLGTAVLQVNQAVTISGNYNQGAGATLQIGVASGATTAGTITDTGYGRLVVTGNSAIAPGSAVTLQSNGYAFAAGQRYVVVDTTGAAVYNPGSLHYSINGYTSNVTGAEVANGSNSDLVLNVVSAALMPTSTPTPSPSPTPSPASIATAPNAVASLTGLTHYTGISSPALLNLFDAALGSLSHGSAATANHIGKQLTPSQPTTAAAAPTIDAMNVVGGHVDGLRLAQADSGSGIATGEGAAQWGTWGQAYGGHASQNERDDVDGYNANYGGLLLGVDHAINSNWRAGGIFSYSNALVNNTGDTEGDSTRINGYGLLGYASYTANPWYVNLSGGVVQQQYDTTRAVNFEGFSGTANGHFSGQQYVARAEAGYPLSLSGFTLTPLASLTYSYQNQGDYTESGGNGAALSVGGSHVNSVKSSLGARVEKALSTSYGQIVPDLQVQWIHEFDHTAQATGASFAADPTGQTAFTTVGATPVQDLADLSLGVTLLRANNLSLSVRYEVQAGGGFVSQTGSVRVLQVF